MVQPLILIVDDDPELRLLFRDIIELDGYKTLAAAQASDALLLLEQYQTIALLLTDLMMPGINGFMLADMAVARWPHLRIIYASGLADLRDAGAQPGRHHGTLLMKPFRAEQLSAAIAATLARPLLSGETMWVQGMRDRDARAPATRASRTAGVV
jgi:CheY-like chemotaxis protein